MSLMFFVRNLTKHNNNYWRKSAAEVLLVHVQNKKNIK